MSECFTFSVEKEDECGLNFYKTVIHCKTTAPMFMAGAEAELNANGRTELIPELRAAGIKGCMRFVWRAVQCASDMAQLRKAEGQLFGNAFGGNNTKQSDMRLRVEKTRLITGPEIMTPHRELPGYNGVDDRGKKKTAFRSPALRSGGTFDTVISGFGDTEKHIKFVRLFVLTCLLYGFGRRSRKGFGTVAITGIDGVGADVDHTFEGAVDNLNALSMFGTSYSLSGDRIVSAPPRRPANYPYIESIKIAGTNAINGTADIIGPIGTAAHLHTGSTFLGAFKPRFASSILLSTVPSAGGKYRCVVTQLNCTKTFVVAERDAFYIELDRRLP